MKNHLRIKNSVAVIKKSAHAHIFRRINPGASFSRHLSLLSERRRKGQEPQFLTTPAVASILDIDRHTALRTIVKTGLIPVEKCSNGVNLISPAVVQEFILDLANAFGLRE